MDERGEQKCVIDYTVGERLRKHMLNAKVFRGMLEGSDHNARLAQIKISSRWDCVKGKWRHVMVSERLDRKEAKEEYERKICERLREVRMTAGMGTSVNAVFNVFNDVLTEVGAEIVGYRVRRDRAKGHGRRKRGGGRK